MYVIFITKEVPRLPLKEKMAFDLEEKRRFPRLNLKAALRYQIRGKKVFTCGLSSDISLGGLGFINDDFIAPNTPLNMEIQVLSRILNPIARTAWSQPLPHSNRYQVGVEFLELDPHEKNYLLEYLDTRIQNL